MPAPESAPRSLTQMLREWDDDSLTGLLHLRPALAFPAPAAFSELATRATTRHAVLDALDGLNAAELAVAYASSVLPTPFTVADVLDWMEAEAGSEEATGVEAAIGQLRRQALVWGYDDALRPVRVLVNAFESDESPAVGRRRSSLTAPDLGGVPRQRQDLIDKAAAGSAFEFMRHIEVLVEHSDHRPVRLTQAGRLAARDLRALGQLLDVDPTSAQSLLEFAHAAGLVGMSTEGLDEVVIPTDRFDEWRSRELPQQWRVFADTWLAQHLGGGSAEMKAVLIAAYGDAADGRTLSADDLRRWLAWHRPRRAGTWNRLIPGFVAQASTIGFTGLGALASFAVQAGAESLAALLPDRVDHVLLQADLTAIAPGPLRPDVASDFAALADVESRGSATVFRFTRESLARAMSLGWTSDDIVATLRTTSRTPVPQPLEYMVRDIERRPIDAATAAVGAAIAIDPDRRHRVPRRAKPYSDDDLTPGDRLDDAFAREIVRTLRVNDSAEADAVDHGSYSESLGGAPLDTIREAVETQEVVWVGYVDRVGTRREQTARLTSVEDGLAQGRDAASGEAVAIPVSRIVAAHIIRSAASR
jgi:hypothetical protein